MSCCHIPYVALHCRDLDFSLAHQFHKIVSINKFMDYHMYYILFSHRIQLKENKRCRLNLSCVKMWPLEFQQDVVMANLDGFKRRLNKFMKGVSIGRPDVSFGFGRSCLHIPLSKEKEQVISLSVYLRSPLFVNVKKKTIV